VPSLLSTPSASLASLPGCSPANPRSTVSSPSWLSPPPASPPASIEPVRRFCSPTRNGAGGTAASSASAKLPSNGRQICASPAGRTRFRLRSRRCTPPPARSPTPTGNASSPSTATSAASSLRRSPISIRRSPSPRPGGPAAGLERVDALADSGALSRCHLLPSVRGELLARLGEVGEAREELLRATKLTTNDRERDVLEDKARQLR